MRPFALKKATPPFRIPSTVQSTILSVSTPSQSYNDTRYIFAGLTGIVNVSIYRLPSSPNTIIRLCTGSAFPAGPGFIARAQQRRREPPGQRPFARSGLPGDEQRVIHPVFPHLLHQGTQAFRLG